MVRLGRCMGHMVWPPVRQNWICSVFRTPKKGFGWVISWILTEKTLGSQTASLGPFGISSSFKLINYKKKRFYKKKLILNKS